MTHLQVDPPSYLKTPPLRGTLPAHDMKHPPGDGIGVSRPAGGEQMTLRVLRRR